MSLDSKYLRLYIDNDHSSTENNTLVEYDPYTGKTAILSFPGITNNHDFMTAGIDYSSSTESIFISAGARTAFFTNGANLTGPNALIEWDLRNRKIKRETNLDEAISQIEKRLGVQIGGFQDMAEDKDGNAYYMATWGNVILKVTPRGVVSLFYSPPLDQLNASAPGFGGLFIHKNSLVVSDIITKSFFRFNLDRPKSAPVISQPASLPSDQLIMLCDSLYLPAKYYGKIMICASDFSYGPGGLSVFRSHDGWRSSQYLGFLAHDQEKAPNTTATATFQASDSIYAVAALSHLWDRTQPNPPFFLLVDITQRLESLINNGTAS